MAQKKLKKRLRRMRDGKIFGFSETDQVNMSQALGMEVVECDDKNNVVRVLGEAGSPGVYGRRRVGQYAYEAPASEDISFGADNSDLG